MRFMMLMYPGPSAENGAMPDEKAIDARMKYNEELIKAGVLLALDGLHPSGKGARIKFSEGGPAVIDGPFTGAGELLGGYWMIQVKSKEDAIQWASRLPVGGKSDEAMIEVRQVFEMSEFGPPIEAAESGPAGRIGKGIAGKTP